VNVKNLKEDS
jgi:hypothetical protein